MFRLLILLLGLVLTTQANVIRVNDISDGRMINADTTNIEQYPYLVSVRLDDEHYCVGSILSERIILTGGMCLYGQSTSKLNIQYGMTKIGGDENIIAAECFIVYPLFNPVNFDYNIGLIILSDDIPLSSTAQPITLAENNPDAGIESTFISWGSETDDTILERSYLTTITNPECSTQWPFFLKIEDYVLCAGIGDEMGNACTGDGAAPLVVDGTLIGMLSWGGNCMLPDHSGVFTRIPYFLDWINNELSLL
ncbi:trypsin-7-like [Teleopsis dalmanni]|uniref:trypsin-7-like n=1 Tax=Teleopsis dalmanni TaxID=139649 RepID=UPI0018CF6ADC|nr:trypsin-7-like [Teleopsis dalmanni]XP_037941353.1 trypsin-7-like [Teleopsis dalmanni]